ncbi:recG: ATP-dependent DNA helicase RecG [Rubrobacter radiotolerans]|uniref:ATP-dependent DNA helicase RecG n=1 Tax=Rubrobacter radiotolerans TaxID=42256 RepID=A0A023X3T8_RUBRA|nr:ATP-dependent DNA helicase RecG [Rubrobacter radiotolerans]AHY46660.1 recG: ATP-dependent DNA helicase RecG [Rubrobacter radiotolerans]MDX5894067.1 ATP-dependent DNA helicase RecG [Rubrobacter radiotolerans]SMC05102.1 ATP-dependent DNA helicase RecG [Rubrobacter radiotolerans DSM 5868]
MPVSEAAKDPGALPPGRTTLSELRRRPVRELPGVGPRVEGALRELRISTLADLVSHYPARHEDLSNVKRISELRVGERATVFGRVVSTKPVGRPVRGRSPGFSVQLYDGTGYMPATVWGRPWLQGQLQPETNVVVSGEVQRKYGLQISVKSIEIVEDRGSEDGPHSGSFVPVYPVNRNIQARRMRALIHRALAEAGHVLDPLPLSVIEAQELVNLDDAIAEIHFPTTKASLKEALRRLVFHELFIIQAALGARRERLARTEVGRSSAGDGSLLNRFLKGLPYSLTPAQERSIAEVLGDMRREKPMQRLLQGDVGSGKTAVAVAALLTAVEAGGQGAIMAPTEVLAEQHFLSFSKDLEGLPVKVVLLTGSQGAAERRENNRAVADGEAHIVVGTHALIQQGVEFRNLSLVVVDEQHRFGVSQRTTIKEKGTTPDTLVMTATPIPRTLSLTLYGDLEVSVIDELPPGRKPVETHVVPVSERLEAYEAVGRELEAGRQAYVICPLVEESEALEDVRAAEELYEELAHEVFPDRSVGLLHGRMKSAEKREAMADFNAHRTDVLVATVVVEVGVNVPNASAIVIEGAERFGLSQLHQLRGRVCRGEHPPLCFLVADPKTGDSEKRLEAMVAHQDGFRLSEVDLAIRGEGTLFGSRQSGVADLKVARLQRDIEVLVEARREAFALVEDDPTLKKPEHRPLRREIRELLGEDVEWLFRD